MADKDRDLSDEAERGEDAPAKGADDDAADRGEPAGEEGSESEAAEPGEVDESAARVADALGVGEADEAAPPGEDEAEAKADEGPQNRAARRREEAIERRRKRKGLPAEKKADDLPKDKNKRAKELLTRRREAAAEQKPAQLEAGEMVDDALARGWASTTKWLRKNVAAVQWVVAIGLVGVASFVAYTYFSDKKQGAASALLASGAMSEQAWVMEEDKRSDDEKEADPLPVFKTPEERDDKALAAYRDVQQKHAGSGAAILAKLGEAGVLLEKRDWDGALAAFDAVLKTPLAAADPDVKGRCIEGLAFAKEGKGDLEGAMSDFRRLESIDAKGYKELSQFHQARLLLAKGTEDDRAKAKDLLKAVYDKLREPSLDRRGPRYLEVSVEQALRALDPSLVPGRETIQSPRGGQMTREEMEAHFRKWQEEQERKKAAGEGDEHGDEH